jgi:hypothetical protein
MQMTPQTNGTLLKYLVTTAVEEIKLTFIFLTIKL